MKMQCTPNDYRRISHAVRATLAHGTAQTRRVTRLLSTTGERGGFERLGSFLRSCRSGTTAPGRTPPGCGRGDRNAIDPQATSVRPKSAPVSGHRPERAQLRNERRACRVSSAPIQRPWLRERPRQLDLGSRRGADDAASNAERPLQTDIRPRALSVDRAQARPKCTRLSSRPRHTTAADDAHATETRCPLPSRSDRLGCSSRRNSC